jgi:hypothetical protein
VSVGDLQRLLLSKILRQFSLSSLRVVTIVAQVSPGLEDFVPVVSVVNLSALRS